MSYGNEEILRRIEKAKASKDKLTHVTDKKNLSIEDKMKIGLCKHFVEYVIEKRMKMKDLSEKLDIPASRLSEITNYKINKFTLDQLFRFLTVLGNVEPKVKAYLDLVGETVELPTMKVTDTKKLTKQVRVYARH